MTLALDVYDSIDYTTAKELRLSCRALYRAPPRLLPSDFADEHLIVTSGPLASGRWQTSFMPYQKGILDAFFEPGVEYVVFQASSQVGKTTSAVVLVAYHIAHDPCTILVVEPTVKPMAEDFSKNRLEPIIDASPVLRDAVSKKRSRDSQNTVLAKTFKGGSIAIGGANSAASLAARTIRFLLLDEVDRYPPELPGEGSTIQIALKRTAAFGSQRRVFITSSPTLKGGPIDVWFHRGDERRYHCPCPECGYMHTFQWRNVVWDKEKRPDGKTTHYPDTARLECPECGHGITNAERIAILEHGEWRAQNTERREKSIVSFHIWEAYSPLSSLTTIVEGFLSANEARKAGDSSELHAWTNTTLGEAMQPVAGEGVESHALLMRCEDYGESELPEGVVCLTHGVDTQDDRLEVLVVGWGIGEESWLIDHQVLAGDTSKAVLGTSEPTPWTALDGLLEKTYSHPSGQHLSVSATCIDSAGHRTDRVYDYAATRAARRVFAVIGRGGNRPIISSPSLQKHGRERRRCLLYTVGVDAAKSLFMGRLKKDEPGEGYIHFPRADWFDDELAKQLTSERLVTKLAKGIPEQVWQQVRARNEGLDMMVYAHAALRLIHPNLRRLADTIANRPTKPTSSSAPKKPPQGRPWLGPRRDGWLDRWRR